MKEVVFKGEKHKIHYDMLAFEHIANEMGANSIEDVGQNLMTKNISSLLKVSRTIAFYGLECAARHNEEVCGFESSEKLGQDIARFTEFNPFTNAFTEAWLGFFGEASEDNEKKSKGAK